MIGKIIDMLKCINLTVLLRCWDTTLWLMIWYLLYLCMYIYSSVTVILCIPMCLQTFNFYLCKSAFVLLLKVFYDTMIGDLIFTILGYM